MSIPYFSSIVRCCYDGDADFDDEKETIWEYKEEELNSLKRKVGKRKPFFCFINSAPKVPLLQKGVWVAACFACFYFIEQTY